ncbi:hypothetical protein CEUSTIGMA_g7426.t1 [Chlamydomonas eustigma]|uniref:Protein kinase domain-containing protein n=1 Tax=Chlamydomonas eustigma TaxID=1157962 RepID=A0A250XA88_9CHLO|nr:hypothetical protein CEUSTIGMA_g7426.t1 [Chlamydomonas eustigma]|eukprot:GAX79987.1 hypothetical protein CEUSTIGMA_g7426.t1 [Chlamydomonas eustigma]
MDYCKSYTNMLLEEYLKTESGRENESNSKPSLRGPPPFKHYRRKKTSKSPRKRTFIANMTKQPQDLSEARLSDAKGVSNSGKTGTSPLTVSSFSFQSTAAGSSQDAVRRALGRSQPAPDLLSLPTIAPPVVFGSKISAHFTHEPAPHTGTYYDAELAAALASYLPDAMLPPKPQVVSWAVTTKLQEMAPGSFGRAVRTGIDATARTSSGSSVTVTQDTLASPGNCSTTAALSLKPADEGTWHASCASQFLSVSQASSYPKPEDAGVVAYSPSPPSPASHYLQFNTPLPSDSLSISQASSVSKDQHYCESPHVLFGQLPLSSSSFGGQSSPPLLLHDNSASSVAAQQIPFALLLDPSSWVKLPPLEDSTLAWDQELQLNPDQVLCHTLVSVGAYGAVYIGTLMCSSGYREFQGTCHVQPPKFKEVAVKLMRQQPSSGLGLSVEKVLSSFRVEAELLPGLSHPNIVPVYYANADPGHGPICLIQELAAFGNLSTYLHANSGSMKMGVEGIGNLGQLTPQQSSEEQAVLNRLAQKLGMTLPQLLNRLGSQTLNPQATAGIRFKAAMLSLLSDVCSALSFLASLPQPIIHRDVKPANILINEDGRAQLADFGVAKVTNVGQHPWDASGPSSLTGYGDSAAAVDDDEAKSLSSLLRAWNNVHLLSEDHTGEKKVGGGDASCQRSLDPSMQPAAKRPCISWNGDQHEEVPEHGLSGLPSAASTNSLHGPQGWEEGGDLSTGWLDDLFREDEDTNTYINPCTLIPAGATAASAGSPADMDALSHELLGTAQYAAPEDLILSSWKSVGPAADMFSFAVCVWEALSSQKPWEGMGSEAVREVVGRKGARPPVNRGWSLRVQQMLKQAWQSDPGGRPNSVSMMEVLTRELLAVLGF